MGEGYRRANHRRESAFPLSIQCANRAPTCIEGRQQFHSALDEPHVMLVWNGDAISERHGLSQALGAVGRGGSLRAPAGGLTAADREYLDSRSA